MTCIVGAPRRRRPQESAPNPSCALARVGSRWLALRHATCPPSPRPCDRHPDLTQLQMIYRPTASPPTPTRSRTGCPRQKSAAGFVQLFRDTQVTVGDALCLSARWQAASVQRCGGLGTGASWRAVAVAQVRGGARGAARRRRAVAMSRRPPQQQAPPDEPSLEERRFRRASRPPRPNFHAQRRWAT